MKNERAEILLLAFGLILLLCLAPAVCEIVLVVTIDSTKPCTVLAPGRHLLGINITNNGTSTLVEGKVLVSLELLHGTKEKNLTFNTEPIKTGNSVEISKPLPLEVPGLYTARVIYRSGHEESEVIIDLEVSGTTDRWQSWREPLEVPNKTHLLLAFYYPW